jgi:ABC-type amino acid transport system, permease component
LLYIASQMGSRGAFEFPYVTSYLVIAAIYISMCAFLSWFAHWLERRLREGSRRKGIPVVEIATDEVTGVEQTGPSATTVQK